MHGGREALRRAGLSAAAETCMTTYKKSVIYVLQYIDRCEEHFVAVV